MLDLTSKGYKLIEAIGVGGMCEVYKAHQIALQRFVAIKILKAKFASDPSQCERFILEAKNCSRLSHPNIVEIFEVDRIDGRPYIAMELVSGETLRKLLDSGVTLKKGIELFIQICEALVCAHEAGIIHRDLKPLNILINDKNEAKVGDWGLSRQLSSTHRVTRTGIILGSPGYMSPEQIQGGQLTHSSDLYSLGIMLFELFAGRPPFTQRRMSDLINAHLRDNAPRLDSLAPTTPSDVADLVARLISKRPEDRPSTAKDVVHSLRASLKTNKEKRDLHTVMCSTSSASQEQRGEKTTVAPRKKRLKFDKAKPRPKSAQDRSFYLIAFFVLLASTAIFRALSHRPQQREEGSEQRSVVFDRAEIVAVDKIALRFSGDCQALAKATLEDPIHKGKKVLLEVDFRKAKAITKQRKEVLIRVPKPLFKDVNLRFSPPLPKGILTARRGEKLTEYLRKLDDLRRDALAPVCHELQAIHGLISRGRELGKAQLLEKNRQSVKRLLATIGLDEKKGRNLKETIDPLLEKNPSMTDEFVHWLFPLRALETCLSEPDEVLPWGRINGSCGQTFEVLGQKEIPPLQGGLLLGLVPQKELHNCWLMTPDNIYRTKQGSAILGSLKRGIKLDSYGFKPPNVDGFVSFVSLGLFVSREIPKDNLILSFSGYRYCREIAIKVSINGRNSLTILNMGYFSKERSKWAEIDTWRATARVNPRAFKKGRNTLEISVDDLPGVKSGLGFKVLDISLFATEG